MADDQREVARRSDRLKGKVGDTLEPSGERDSSGSEEEIDIGSASNLLTTMRDLSPDPRRKARSSKKSGAKDKSSSTAMMMQMLQIMREDKLEEADRRRVDRRDERDQAERALRQTLAHEEDKLKRAAEAAERQKQEDADLRRREQDRADAAAERQREEFTLLLRTLQPADPAVRIDVDGVDAGPGVDRVRLRREEEARRETSRVDKVIQTLPTFKETEGTSLSAFLRRLEAILETDRVPRGMWVRALRRVLGGRVGDYLNTHVTPEALAEYRLTKTALLSFAGLNQEHLSGQSFWQVLG